MVDENIEDNRPPARPIRKPSEEEVIKDSKDGQDNWGKLYKGDSSDSQDDKEQNPAKRKIPWPAVIVSGLLFLWTVASASAPTYGSRLASFESQYGVDSSEISGCWSERGGEWVNTCASRAELGEYGWLFPGTLFLIVALSTLFLYIVTPPPKK